MNLEKAVGTAKYANHPSSVADNLRLWSLDMKAQACLWNERLTQLRRVDAKTERIRKEARTAALVNAPYASTPFPFAYLAYFAV